MKRRRVVLLGPDGQLGSDLRQAHANAGEPFELIRIGRDQLDVSRWQAVEQGLADASFNAPFDVLVNCTGYHTTDEAEDNAAAAFAVNAHAVRAMARACAKRKARFVHVSTDYVFGGDRQRRSPLCEQSPTAPVNVYGASKALGETFVFAEMDNALVLRVASLFGVRGARAKGGNFVETMIRVGRERGSLRVVDDQAMSPTATADVAEAMLPALFAEHTGVLHVVNSGATTWFHFAAEIIRQAGVNAAVAPCASADYPTRALRPRYSVLDNSKAAAALGRIRPWQDALERYLRARGFTGGDAGRDGAR